MSGLEGLTREELKALVLSLHETIVKQQETIKVLEAKMSFERELMATALPFLGKKKPQSVLAGRIEKFLAELFVFVEEPYAPSDNNAAER